MRATTKKLPAQPKKGSSIAFSGTDIPGSRKSAMQLIAESPVKTVSFRRVETVDGFQAARAAGRWLLVWDGKEFTDVASDDVRAEFSRGEVWEG